MRIALLLGTTLVLAAWPVLDAADAQTRRSGASQARKPAPRPAPRPAARPPAPPPAPFLQGPGGPVGQGAALYRDYLADAEQIRDITLTSPQVINDVVARIARHPGQRLARASIAYGGLVAVQDAAFVAGVRETAAFYGKDAMLRGLTLDARYVRSLKGGEGAARGVARAIRADAQALDAIALRYQMDAYGLQKQTWALARIPDVRQRVAAARALPIAARTGDAALATGFAAPVPAVYDAAAALARAQGFFPQFPLGTLADRLEPVIVTPPPPAPPPPPPPAPTRRGARNAPAPVAAAAPIATAPPPPPPPAADTAPLNRMVTLGAMLALGATDEPAVQTRQVMEDRLYDGCFESARLNLNQCIAASRFHYETPFCIAKHPVGEVAKCLGEAVGASLIPVAGAAPAAPAAGGGASP
jgi:hypothetical protein